MNLIKNTTFFILTGLNFNFSIVNSAVLDFNLVPSSSTQTVTEEWCQHGHDPQRTGYTNQVVPHPWRWRWAWNGPNSSGGISSGKTILGRITQPVTGGGRVYIARGYDFTSYWNGHQVRVDGVYALNASNGQVIWSVNPGGNIITTVAYDHTNDTLFVGSTNGYLYKLNASDGTTISSFNAGSAINFPPCLINDRVFISAGTKVIAVDKNTMTQIWAYDTSSNIQTPPSYSATRNRVVVGCYDLYVNCINNSDGSLAWRVKPTSRVPGDPNTSGSNNYAEYLHGWPVIAEVHGYVLIKAHIDWNAIMGVWSPWPTDNATIRSNLQSRTDQQCLFCLDLDDGSIPFICNVGHGGWADGNLSPMGPQPVVKKFQDNTEVVYTLVRGHTMYDGRWDSHFGEMLLDDTTVPGYLGGYIRYIRNDYPPGSTSANQYFLTDEQPYITMSGNYLFACHWEACAITCMITDRSPSLGSWTNKINTQTTPTVVTSQDGGGCSFSSSHYCSSGLQNTRSYNPGFYIYYNQGSVYDNYWSEYGCVVVSSGMILVRSCDGAVICLESGSPTGSLPSSQEVRFADAGKTYDPEIIAINPGSKDRVSTGPELLSIEETRNYIGQIKKVEGVVREVFSNGKAVYICFKKPHKGSFLVKIMKEDWNNFSINPLNIVSAGDKIRVKGKIVWYQGDPAIYVKCPEEIEILEKYDKILYYIYNKEKIEKLIDVKNFFQTCYLSGWEMFLK